MEELSRVKGSRVHVPWTLGRGELEKAGVELGANYPHPMVVAPEWAKHAAGKKDRNSRGQPAKGQKGIDFYYKAEPRTGGGGKRGGKPPLKGGRVQ